MKVESRFILDAIFCVGLCVLCVNGKTACTRTSSNSKIQLHLACSDNQMIHVVSELVGHADNSSTSCGVSRKISTCSKHRTSDRTGLIVNCNGHSSCDEVMSTSIKHCPGGISDKTAEIEYQCIERSVDICGGHSVPDGRPLYLHSPGFPGNNKSLSYCQCTVSGVDMKVLLLHYQATYGAFWIRTDTGVVWPTSEYSTEAYNREIPRHYSGDLTIYYDNTAVYEHRVWIRITGAKTLSCTHSALPWSSTTVQTVTPVNTSPSVDKTDSTTFNRTSSTETSTLTSSKTSTSLKTSDTSTSSRPRTTNSTTLVWTTSTESTSLNTSKTSTSPVQTTTNSTLVDRTSTTESSSLNKSRTSSPGQTTTNSPLPIVWIAAALGAVVVVVILTGIVVFALCRCHRRKPDNTVNGYDIPRKATPATSHDYELPPVNNYCEIDLGRLNHSLGNDAEQETLKSKETPLPHYFGCDSNFTKSGSPADCNHSDGNYGWPRAANGIKGDEQKANHANTYDHLDTWNYDDTTTAGRDVDVCLGAEQVFDESHVVDQNQSHMVDNDIYCGGSDDGTASCTSPNINLPPKPGSSGRQLVDRSHMVDNDIYCGGPDDGTASGRLSDMNLPPKYKPAEGQSVDRSHMVDNDIYCGGPSDVIRQTDHSPSSKSSSISSPPESRSTGRQLGDQSHMVDNDIYVGGPTDDASCSRSSSINLPLKSKPTERQSYDEIDINELKDHEGNVKDDDGGWVDKDVYHSYSDV